MIILQSLLGENGSKNHIGSKDLRIDLLRLFKPENISGKGFVILSTTILGTALSQTLSLTSIKM